MDDPTRQGAKLLRQTESTGELAKLLRQTESLLVPPRNVTSFLEEIRNSRAVSDFAEQQKTTAKYLASRQSTLSQFSPDYLDTIAKVSQSFTEMTSELARAADFARMSGVTEALRAAEGFKLPHFEFPTFPELILPEIPEVDWEGTIRVYSPSVVRLADRGWTVAAWMSFPDIKRMAESSDEEIDDFFLQNYLGTNGRVPELRSLWAELLSSSEIDTWRALLEEVFSCIELGKYRVCVPSLVAVIEGFTVQALYKQSKASRRELKVAVSLKKAKWHEDQDFNGLMWKSVVVFLEHLFAHSDFESTSPTFINRHWIQHGRSDTEWTAADALKLVNALATLHWLST
jgi:hypothetical protein